MKLLYTILLLSLSACTIAQDGDKPVLELGSPSQESTVEYLVARSGEINAEVQELPISLACETDSQCKSMPIGAAACGGPSSFVNYSTKTDASVQNKLKELSLQSEEVDTKLNQLQASVGICLYQSPDVLSCKDKLCTAENSDIY